MNSPYMLLGLFCGLVIGYVCGRMEMRAQMRNRRVLHDRRLYERPTGAAEAVAAALMPRLNCRDAGWRPTCDQCAAGLYQRCRYIVPVNVQNTEEWKAGGPRDICDVPSDHDIEVWADAFINKNAYNRPSAIAIATAAAKWTRNLMQGANRG